jgi:hypothetical protein
MTSGVIHPGRHAQTALGILAGVGMVLHLGNVLIGNQPHQTAPVVHDGQLLDFVVEQHLGSVLQLGLAGRNQSVAGGHDLADGTLHVALETQVAVGDDADEPAVAVDDRDTADFVLAHQLESIAHGVVARNGHGVVNHAVLGTLHPPHVRGLLGDGHVLMDDADAALAGQCDGKRSFRHGIHGGGHDGDVELDITRETGPDADLPRQHFRIGGYQQHVVEGKTLGLDPFIDKRHKNADFCCLQK